MPKADGSRTVEATCAVDPCNGYFFVCPFGICDGLQLTRIGMQFFRERLIDSIEDANNHHLSSLKRHHESQASPSTMKNLPKGHFLFTDKGKRCIDKHMLGKTSSVNGAG